MPREEKKTTTEVRLGLRSPAPGAMELLRDVLTRAGIDPVAQVEDWQGGRAALVTYCASAADGQALVKRVQALGLRQVTVAVRVLVDADWQNAWKENIRPFNLGQGFRVIPAWNPGPPPRGRRTPIFLDTTLAFGTGLHETTRFTAELIEENQARLGRFLDVGTGAGLLAIVASLCGADSVEALDIDPDCVRVARENMARNHRTLDQSYCCDLADFRPARPYDFVAANLVSHDLVALRKRLLALVAPGGYLVVSGISLENLPRVQAAYKESGLRCRRIRRGRQWAAVLYKRPQATR